MSPTKPADRKTISVHCRRCRTRLYRYKKGGTGGLVKCYLDRIVEDATDGGTSCPECGQEFARPITIAGKPANKIIAGKVYTKGMRRR
jgi:uncharacterized Zn finger protein (UPF0148 family)